MDWKKDKPRKAEEQLIFRRNLGIEPRHEALRQPLDRNKNDILNLLSEIQTHAADKPSKRNQKALELHKKGLHFLQIALKSAGLERRAIVESARRVAIVEANQFFDLKTDLPLGNYLKQRLIEQIGSMLRQENFDFKFVTLFYGDGDGMKKINDTFSEGVGDKFLHKLANFLKFSFKSGDTVARDKVTGDEFWVLSANLNQEIAEERANEVSNGSHTFFSQEPEIGSANPGISMGAISYSRDEVLAMYVQFVKDGLKNEDVYSAIAREMMKEAKGKVGEAKKIHGRR